MSQSSPCSLLIPLPAGWLEKLERAALREKWARQDWARHFAHRMSYAEYHYIGILTRDVVEGRIGEDQARQYLSDYRKLK